MTRLLVVGRTGQLARALACAAKDHPRLELIFMGRPELDLLDPRSVTSAITRSAPDIVINTAAWTDVDGAEDRPERALQINAEGARSVAQASAECGALLLHISTDYVFDGKSARPYREEDRTGPLNLYGLSKLLGERAVKEAGRSIVVRTSWLYSPFGRNFVTTMLEVGRRNEVLRIVADQTGCPTSALDLADALLAIAPTLSTACGETFHCSGGHALSWFGFAQAIFEQAQLSPAPRLVPVSSEEWSARARRPSYSVLDCSKFATRFEWAPPSLNASISRVLAQIRKSSRSH